VNAYTRIFNFEGDVPRLLVVITSHCYFNFLSFFFLFKYNFPCSFHQMAKAAMAALEEKQMASENGSSYTKPLVIETSHFEKALKEITPSVSEKVWKQYKY